MGRLTDTVTVQSPVNPDECFPICTLAEVDSTHPLNGVLDEKHLVLMPTYPH